MRAQSAVGGRQRQLYPAVQHVGTVHGAITVLSVADGERSIAHASHLVCYQCTCLARFKVSFAIEVLQHWAEGVSVLSRSCSGEV